MMTLLLSTIARSSSNHDQPPSSLKVMISLAALVRQADGCEDDLKDAVRISVMSSAIILFMFAFMLRSSNEGRKLSSANGKHCRLPQVMLRLFHFKNGNSDH